MEPVHFIVNSDYLCPWCYNGAVRLDQLEREADGGVRIEWRTYLLRPRPNPRRDLEKFRAYTRSWLRPASEPESGEFQVWEGDAGPPSHSIPPHLVAKAAARCSDDAFREIHRRLLHAYFAESRDVTDVDTLRALWAEAGLPAAAFDDHEDPELLRQTLAEHDEAIEAGVTGVPSVRLAGNDAVITGAHPLELYRRWVGKIRSRAGQAS